MKIIVAVTGASGSLYAQRLFDRLHELRSQIDEVCVVFSQTAKDVWQSEMPSTPNLYDFMEYADTDFFAPIASGSAKYDAMVVCPCSVGTMGRIAHGTAETLISRAADVMLKERRKLILAVRETPFSLIHIKNMELITLAGGIICPANPSFYSRPQTVADVCDTVIDRIIDLLGLENNCFRWGK
ncbi:MAG: UbiX family flavin prenyltransferase [Bacteroidales bacterium]|nr:UbiX family flavin prenyltransferase [Bacteroidales bacterium]